MKMKRNIWSCATSVALLSAVVTAAGHGKENKGRNEKHTSPKALRAEIEELRLENVAWRQIHWNTCLLEGIKESRRLKKPMILWIFIDRPVDDERC